MYKKPNRRGFTLVELSLSLVFIGILSVAIVFMINSTIVSYRRALTLSKINTTGSDITEDIRASIHNSSQNLTVSSLCSRNYVDGTTARDNCEAAGAYDFTQVTRYSNVTLNGQNLGDTPIYGAICTGPYSYIWTSGYFFSTEDVTISGFSDPPTFNYVDNTGVARTYESSGARLTGKATANSFRLLKVRDDNHAVCISKMREVNSGHADRYSAIGTNSITKTFDISSSQYGTVTEDPVDIIVAGGSNDLAIYDLSIARPAESLTKDNIFYSVSFIMGTIQGGMNIKAKGKSCAAPAEYGSGQFEYCAINKFNFAAQSGGRSSK